MTFILTLISEGSTRSFPERVGPLSLDPVVRDDGAADRAGFLPGLRRFLGRSVHGSAVHVLIREQDGYESSNQLFAYGEEDEPARVRVPAEMRGYLEEVIEHGIAISSWRRLLIIAEDNGHVTDSDISVEDAETVDILGPMPIDAFWHLVELGEVLEDSIIIIETG